MYTLNPITRNNKRYISGRVMLSSRGHVVCWSSLEDVMSYNSSNGNKGTILFSMSNVKRFVLQLDRSSFINFPSSLCLCEVVIDDTARAFIDFDDDVSLSIEDISYYIKSYVQEKYNVECSLSWKWSDGEEGKRWHCVISGLYFYRCWRENNFHIAEKVSKEFQRYDVDMGVYRNNSSLRMLGQLKYKNGKFCRRLYPYSADTLDSYSIHPTDDKKIQVAMPIPSTVHDTAQYVEYNTKFTVPQGLVVHRVNKSEFEFDVVFLRRVHRSHCIVCNRMHDNVGAYIICKHDRTEYICYRDKSKVLVFF